MNRTVSISLDDDDDFFDSCDRLSSVVPLDLALVADDDDDEFFDSSRMSFARGASIRATSIKRIYSIAPVKNTDSAAARPAYDMWIAEPGDVNERRKRLLQGMGLVSNKDLLRIATSKVVRTVSIKPDSSAEPAAQVSTAAAVESSPPHDQESKPKLQAVPLRAIVLVRSRSDGDIDVFSNKTKQRKLETIGPVSKNKLTRTLSGKLSPGTGGACQLTGAIRLLPEADHKNSSAPQAAKNGGVSQCVVSDAAIGSFFLIKNLDTGSDFIVNEFNEQGMWNKLNDLKTGKQLTMDEFEKSVGYSPVVKEMMRRVSRNKNGGEGKKNSHFAKSFRSSTKKGTALLKNLKGAASGFLVVEKMEKLGKEAKEGKEEKDQEKDHEKDHDKEQEKGPAAEEKVQKHSSQWVEAHQHGKSVKEFTALHYTQEIQAHEGSIWTMQFSSDHRFLATGGEDTNVHVWEVQECEVMPPPEESSSEADHPVDEVDDDTNSNRLALADVATLPSELRKKGKKTAKGAIPDYVKLPETVVGLSEKPKYSLKGHKDEVLDLSWSQSQVVQFLSSLQKT